ncbi:MAG: XTP/dITP diphosphatase [Oscillospiraceae bacterium]|nr:XTP/dITP diphosphatase [Oscillospiraceae bacterium]
MKAILASNNKNKLVEMNAILSELGIEVLSQAEAGIALEVEETGETFEENSLLKATAVCQAAGMTAIADDSGLMVDALDGAPGVYSHRYGTPDLDDAGRTALLLKSMEGETNRTCRFVCVITCCFPDGRKLVARGECVGQIADAPVGENGFGYDPVFYLPELGKTFAQLDSVEKNAISHRGRALSRLVELLRQEL